VTGGRVVGGDAESEIGAGAGVSAAGPATSAGAGATSAAGAVAGCAIVIGYGNSLRSDDGIGWHAAARLAGDARLGGAVVLQRHQLTPELALDVSGASLVVFVDAVDGDEAGSITVRRLDPPAAAGSAWSHHLEPTSLLALARDLYGTSPPAFVVSVGTATLDVGDRLSPPVERALAGVVDAVVGIVAGHASDAVVGIVAGHASDAVARIVTGSASDAVASAVAGRARA
jgi:hydrogenase maturation protease